jgi:hypothetical protein
MKKKLDHKGNQEILFYVICLKVVYYCSAKTCMSQEGSKENGPESTSAKLQQ